MLPSLVANTRAGPRLPRTTCHRIPCMADGPTDPRWPATSSRSRAHEFRSPLTVVAGYIRMLLKDRAGPSTDHAAPAARRGREVLRPAVGPARRDERSLAARGGHRSVQPQHGQPARHPDRGHRGAARAARPDRDDRPRRPTTRSRSHGDAVRLQSRVLGGSSCAPPRAGDDRARCWSMRGRARRTTDAPLLDYDRRTGSN